MSLTTEYKSWLKRLDSAVARALKNEVCEDAKQALSEQMDKVVYSYAASDWAMSTRRYDSGGLADKENFSDKYTGGNFSHELTIEDVADFQGTDASGTLIHVVETGAAGYRQPHPRPVMQETQNELDGGRASGVMAAALKSRGF